MVNRKDAQSQAWNSLYARLRYILNKYGKESSMGSGDYWIVDDNWGYKSHKVCVFTIEFLTNSMIEDIKRALQRYSADWCVVFSLELRNQGAPVSTYSDEGLTIYRDRVEEKMDRDRLKHLFGDRFRLVD